VALQKLDPGRASRAAAGATVGRSGAAGDRSSAPHRRPWARGFSSALLLAVAFGRAPAAQGRSLDQVIPGLFGGGLGTTIRQDLAGGAVQQPRLAQRFRDLPAALAAARSQSPIASATGAFRFAWDDDLDTFVRSEQSLGPGLAERALTLGKGVFTLGFSSTHADFDTLEGDDLGSLKSQQPSLPSDFLADLPPSDQARYSDDILETRLDLKFSLNLFYLSAAYGLTDSIDLSFALAINQVHMRGRAMALILDPLDNGASLFAFDQPGVIRDGTGPICSNPLRCAEDNFDESAAGTGDIYLRAKWNFANTTWVDFAASGVLTIPTGNADDFLGFHDPTFTPWLIASKTFGRISPHLNLGYAVRSGKDVSQAQWIAGADLLATRWLTINNDFLGYHDDDRDGKNDDVLQYAFGFKINPIRSLVIGGTVQFPLNRDGLRADVIYSTQLEYTF